MTLPRILRRRPFKLLGVALTMGVLAACAEAWVERVGAERYRVFREVLEEVALG